MHESSVHPAAPPPSPPSYGDVLAEVTANVDYLRVTTDPAVIADPAQGWIGCSSLIESPVRLLELVRSTSGGRGTADEMIAASLFVHSYAFRIASVVLAPWALGLPVPNCSPGNTYVKITRNRPGAVAIDDLAVAIRSAEEVVGELFSGHFAPHIDAILATITIGKRLLWGNVAAACSTVFRALDGAPDADRVAIQARAAEFADAAAPWIDGLGNHEIVREGHDTGWFWTRTVCCLWYQCQGGFKCSDCSLTSAADLDATRRSELLAAAR